MKAGSLGIRFVFKVAFAGAAFLCLVGCGLLNQVSKLENPTPMNVAGNWQFDLMNGSGGVGAVATGFLEQSGSNVTGALDIAGCDSNAGVTGTVGGTNGPTSINLSAAGAQNLNIVGSGIGSITPGNAIEGSYTIGAIGCSISGLTSTVSAQQINPVSGAFHGALTSKNVGTFSVSGNLMQGQNGGAVTAPLSGTASVTNSTCFTSVNLTGTISGTSVVLDIASSDGSQTAQLTAPAQSNAGQLISGTPGSFTITQLSGSYRVNTGSCAGDSGTFNVSFP
jgi:hypothetical protein